jgi:hypothetical protein
LSDEAVITYGTSGHERTCATNAYPLSVWALHDRVINYETQTAVHSRMR